MESIMQSFPRKVRYAWRHRQLNAKVFSCCKKTQSLSTGVKINLFLVFLGALRWKIDSSSALCLIWSDGQNPLPLTEGNISAFKLLRVRIWSCFRFPSGTSANLNLPQTENSAHYGISLQNSPKPALLSPEGSSHILWLPPWPTIPSLAAPDPSRHGPTVTRHGARVGSAEHLWHLSSPACCCFAKSLFFQTEISLLL